MQAEDSFSAPTLELQSKKDRAAISSVFCIKETPKG